jgi:LmbE family N-acetylglucosaminyl deacetylase
MIGFLVTSVFWQQAMSSTPQYTQYNRTVSPSSLVLKKEIPERGFIRPLEVTSKIQPQEKSPTISLKQQVTLVIAPHPDDEVLCCGKTIQSRLREGNQIKVLYLTNGDALDNETVYSARQYGLTRRKESQDAMKMIGVRPQDLFFLGYPDAQLSDLSNEILKSRYTGFSSSYQATTFPKSPYTRLALKQNLKTLISQWEPTEIFIPSEVHDDHPDHKMAGKLAKEIIQELGITPKVYSYTVHQSKCEQGICAGDQDSDREKLRWLQVFKSQMPDTHHRNFLEQFARIREGFGKILVGYTGSNS